MMYTDHDNHSQTLAHKLAGLFAEFTNVRAVALAGSQASGMVDATSDIDLYVYFDPPTIFRSLTARCWLRRLGELCAPTWGLEYWGPGDEWFDAVTGIEVDVVYFEASWIEEQLERVLRRHQANQGYTTCFWNTIRNSQVLYDPQGWFQSLQQACRLEYPETLRRNIIALNYPVLRRIIPSYLHQIEKAVRRNDRVSINHRLAALFASYFDLLFAFNRVLHPGEKRMLAFALDHCASLPDDFGQDVEAVLQAAGSADLSVTTRLGAMLDYLDDLLREDGFDLATIQPV